MSAKLVVIYPNPSNAEEFERAYTEDHAAMVNDEHFPGIKRFVQTKVLGTADGSPPPYSRIAELYFDSLEDLQAAATSEGAAKAVAHANQISTGGPPTVLVCQHSSTDY